MEKNQTRIDELILDMLGYSKDREPVAEPTDLPSLVADRRSGDANAADGRSAGEIRCHFPP